MEIRYRNIACEGTAALGRRLALGAACCDVQKTGVLGIPTAATVAAIFSTLCAVVLDATCGLIALVVWTKL